MRVSDAYLSIGDFVSAPRDDPPDWIVVGWFTPDYRAWAGRLMASLEAVGASYHIRSVEKCSARWCTETMRKPAIVQEFRRLYPGRTLILLDVDCTVVGDLAPLTTEVTGDFAAHVMGRRQGRGKERARLKLLSGTMVIRPTEGADRFLGAWREAIAECGENDVDQAALLIAMARGTQFTFQPIGAKWCSYDGNFHPEAAVIHDNASASSSSQSWGSRLRSWVRA